MNWPADEVQHWPLDRLVPSARNARTHSDAQVTQIAGSMREFGWTNAVLADEEGGLIAGHERVLAARLLGWTEARVVVVRGWSEQKKRAYMLADNKLALNAAWDEDLLRAELADLQAMGADLGLVGFDAAEVSALLGGEESLTDPDETPEPEGDPVSRPGDAWVLGRHRLVCGDCTDRAAVELALAGARPHLMVTDPPYGVGYDPAWRNKAAGSATRRTGKVLNEDRADWRAAWALFPGEVCYVWHGALHATTVAESLAACGFDLRAQIVWAKDAMVLGRGHYHWRHEPCRYAVRAAAGATGGATGAGPRSGRSRAATRTPPPCTGRRSRWSACAGPSRTTRRRATPSTSPSRDPAPRSWRPR